MWPRLIGSCRARVFIRGDVQLRMTLSTLFCLLLSVILWSVPPAQFAWIFFRRLHARLLKYLIDQLQPHLTLFVAACAERGSSLKRTESRVNLTRSLNVNKALQHINRSELTIHIDLVKDFHQVSGAQFCPSYPAFGWQFNITFGPSTPPLALLSRNLIASMIYLLPSYYLSSTILVDGK